MQVVRSDLSLRPAAGSTMRARSVAVIAKASVRSVPEAISGRRATSTAAAGAASAGAAGTAAAAAAVAAAALVLAAPLPALAKLPPGVSGPAPSELDAAYAERLAKISGSLDKVKTGEAVRVPTTYERAPLNKKAPPPAIAPLPALAPDVAEPPIRLPASAVSVVLCCVCVGGVYVFGGGWMALWLARDEGRRAVLGPLQRAFGNALPFVHALQPQHALSATPHRHHTLVIHRTRPSSRPSSCRRRSSLRRPAPATGATTRAACSSAAARSR